jgi:hypothetical protein
MTDREHFLLLLLFFKQRQSMRVLLNILRSREVITGDDEAAFASALTQDADLNGALFDEAREAYLLLADSLGIQTGLDKLPEMPSEWFRPPER